MFYATSARPPRLLPFFSFAGTLSAALVFAALAGCTKNAAKSSTDASSSATDASPGKGSNSTPNLETPSVRIETSAGPITVKLDGIQAPGTVRNFLNYVNDKFYDNTIVHYVDPSKLILAGGYNADRTPKPSPIPIRSEAHNGLKNVRGTIAMTRDPDQIDSATSQFFINLTDAPQRDHTGDTADKYGYCVFGRVTEGLEVADKISQSPTADKGGDLTKTPDPPVVIKSIRVVESSR
ncbi:MAG TPA: peptidylprolyl isomerase [Lacipirellulaceae bacterium]|nr:peptidylprolyl isomerase [Lacipirellulaceae bacterium]